MAGVVRSSSVALKIWAVDVLEMAALIGPPIQPLPLHGLNARVWFTTPAWYTFTWRSERVLSSPQEDRACALAHWCYSIALND